MNKDVRTITTWLIHGVHSAPPSVVDAAKRLSGAKRAKAQRRASLPKHPALERENRKARQRRESAKERRRRVYAEVDARSGHRCEVEPVEGARCRNVATEHDHFWGKAKAIEATENVWHLCRICHRFKTDNLPARRDWIEVFQDHCRKHGYAAEVAKCDRALALEAAQHPESKETKS